MPDKFKLTIEGSSYEVEGQGGRLLVNGQAFPVTISASTVTVAGTPHDVDVRDSEAVVDGITYAIEVQGLEEPGPGHCDQAAAAAEGSIAAIMPGLVVEILKAEGDRVTVGETVVVLEVMKMNNELKANKSGILKQMLVKVGENVKLGQILATIE